MKQGIENLEFWFIAGSQFLYGEETLNQVEKNSRIIVDSLNASGHLPWRIKFKGIVKTSTDATEFSREANYDKKCAGLIVFCHTFSPSKMWITGLKSLEKPYLHLHTQFNSNIPNEEIDMDYMNLHQSAHGDREHGFIVTRLRIPRKIVVGHYEETEVQENIAKYMRAAVGAAFSRDMRVMRFGDNMREVAVTEGDKVEAQIKLGWEVNTWAVGLLVDTMNEVTEDEIAAQVDIYHELYDFNTDKIETIQYQAREEIAIKKLLDDQGCSAFSNTFEDLYGMDQLPGLATQDLMRQGYGYGGEGDWKVSAMTSIMKAMSFGLANGTSFMEDYTYDFENGLILGAHMLEVCPTVASDRPRIEVHELGIGGKQPPARIVFNGKGGNGIAVSLIDMGGRLRLIVADIECVEPTQTMPNLPVARVMWKPEPNLKVGAHAWILAGGAHHTVLSLDLDAEIMRDFANILGIEFVHISKDTDLATFEDELQLKDLLWKLK
ncbi:MAG: L-arabinose isomerase [Clostridiales Family XIII bacterium]|jgi:L-arabinose isomerase|nr:L-arabinose isomerase [Clostridiales Family XIII bacterium]